MGKGNCAAYANYKRPQRRVALVPFRRVLTSESNIFDHVIHTIAYDVETDEEDSGWMAASQDPKQKVPDGEAQSGKDKESSSVTLRLESEEASLSLKLTRKKDGEGEGEENFKVDEEEEENKSPLSSLQETSSAVKEVKLPPSESRKSPGSSPKKSGLAKMEAAATAAASTSDVRKSPRTSPKSKGKGQPQITDFFNKKNKKE